MAITLAAPTTSRAASESLADAGDRRLLALFSEGGELAEDAFATLVKRHGPMVLRVGRSLLRDEHEANDLFQTTFLVLARKARRIWVGDSLGPWLHGVACKVARDTRKMASRRQSLERKAPAMSPDNAWEMADSNDRAEAAAALHEEIARLSEVHRAAVVFCDLQGRTHAEAAKALGWPVGTVKSRQIRAREQLRGRLSRRGLALSAGALVALLAAEKRSAVAAPPDLTRSTVRAALKYSSGGAAAATAIVTPPILEQARRVSHGLTIAWPKLVLGIIAVVAASGSLLVWRSSDSVESQEALTATTSARNPAPMGSLAGLRWMAERRDAWDPEVYDETNAPFHAWVKHAKSRTSRSFRAVADRRRTTP
ncbi:MAG: RNA polymerase sigma factor [Isosphaeraceae bacterium]|nr:RNA polymerase sigma factor [Isosphaeraceae bacterium]